MKNYTLNVPLLLFVIIIQHVLCQTPSDIECIIRDSNQAHNFNYTGLSESDITITDQQAKENIILRLCSPLSRNCAGRSSYGVCLTKDDTEIGIGKYPPKLTNEFGAQRFIFTGDPCEGNKNHTVHIIMKCDYSATGPSKPVPFPKAGDPCAIYMIWHTVKACLTPKKTNCSVVDKFNNTYDLSPLTATSDNHIAYIGNNGTLKMNINVCQSVIYEHGATCYKDSGACLENSSDSTNIQYYNYGDVADPLSIVNGTLQISYDKGISCKSDISLENYQTTIFFICDPEATENTEPKFINENKPCEIKFSWKTALACNQTYLNHYRAVNDSKCAVVNPRTKFRYNLRTLMGKNFVSNTTSDTQYKFRICGPLPDSGCTQGTGVCKTNDSTSAGTANSNLMWRHGGPYLNYTDGSACGNDKKRYTLIAFVCGAEGSPDSPVVVKDEPCYLIIHWYTLLACENITTVCATANNETNLLPLIRATKNYVVKTADTEFHINVCRPVVPTMNLACPHGSSACGAVKNSKNQYTNEISLGFPDENPVRLDNDNVILNYRQGSPCPEYPEKNISSSLQFLCDYNGDRGIPKYKNYSNCNYVFEWKTNIVCSAVVGNMVSPCTIKDPSHSHEVNLSLLYHKQSAPRLVTSKGKTYSVSICGGEKHCNGSAVCQGTNGYGTFSTVTFDYRNNVIKLQYLNGSKCSTKSYVSELSLICNSTAGIGEPKLSSDDDDNCGALFEWQTNVTCPQAMRNVISVLSTTTEKTLITSSENYTATKTFVITGMLLMIILVIGIWLYMRNPQRCVHLRSRISKITAARNHSRVQYSRVNTTEEAHLLLDTTDVCTDGQIYSDEELLGV